MRRESIDWLGYWYDILEQRGQNHHIRISELDGKLNVVRSFLFHHGRKDGAGALSHIYREQLGKRLDPPKSREQKAPAMWRRPSLLRQALKNMESLRPQWKHFDLSRKNNKSFRQTIGFTVEETENLQRYCRRSNFSSSAFLLDCINQNLLKELAHPLSAEQSCYGKWLFPVNMRGPVTKPDDEANHASAIYLDADAKAQPADIHKQIKELLTSKVHWGIWWLAHIGKIVGKKMMRKLSLNSSLKSFYIGTFSNMGQWNNVDDQQPKSNRWQIEAPGSANYPIGIVCLIWNEQMTLSLKINRSILPESGPYLDFAGIIKQSCLERSNGSS